MIDFRTLGVFFLFCVFCKDYVVCLSSLFHGFDPAREHYHFYVSISLSMRDLGLARVTVSICACT